MKQTEAYGKTTSVIEKEKAAIQTSIKIEEFDGLELWLMGQDRFQEFNEFVYRVYSGAFREGDAIPFTFQDIEDSSRLYFDRAKLCAVYHTNGTLLGTWGLILKDLQKDDFPLPVETRYGMTVAQIITAANAPEVRFLFNGWRTAIDKDAIEKLGIARSKSIFIFDLLLRGLTADFGEESSQYLGVAEMEMLVLKYHRRVGIPWIIMSEPLHFWGRDRYACAFKLGEFEGYLKKHHPERHDFFYRK